MSGDSMVINVTGRVEFSNCAFVDFEGGVILNVVGKGPSIRVGREVYGPAILAPDRMLVAAGAADDDATYVQRAWVKKFLVDGFSVMYDFNDMCPR